MKREQTLIDDILQRSPTTQAIYLLGSHGTPHEGTGSDIDLAILLPPAQAEEFTPLEQHELQTEPISIAGRSVDLINLRLAPTMLQKEVIAADRLLCSRDETAVSEFELRVLKSCQKLNQERARIVQDAYADALANARGTEHERYRIEQTRDH